MSKIGVGIGEDFPADDSKSSPSEEDRGDTQCNDAEYAARREAYRKWREQRRQWRREWRDAWRARRRAFRHQMQQSIDETYRDHRGHPFHWGHGIVWGALALITALVLFALISFVFSHIFVIVGAVAVLALFVAYHRGFDPFDLPPHDYSHNTPPSEAAH